MAGFGISPGVEKHFIRTKTLDNCSFRGPLYGAEKEKFWDEIDVLLLFSRSEGWPMVVLEAILHEVPILLSHETNVADFVEQYQVGRVVSDFTGGSNVQALLCDIGSFESAWSAHVAHRGFDVLFSKLVNNP
jgi:glycosyltransferase involved in cell wall biosynthesis